MWWRLRHREVRMLMSSVIMIATAALQERQGRAFFLVFFVVMQLLPHSMPTRHVITFNLLQSTMISTLMN
jgi:hypothetical protein